MTPTAFRPWILVAEDDPNDRQLFMEAFDEVKIPFDVEFVDDFNKVLGYLNYRFRTSPQESNLPLLIVLDFYLPGGMATDLVEGVKTDDRYNNIPIVVMSGKAPESSMKVCKELGAIQCLLKPGNYADLLNFVRDLSDWASGNESYYRREVLLTQEHFKRTGVTCN